MWLPRFIFLKKKLRFFFLTKKKKKRKEKKKKIVGATPLGKIGVAGHSHFGKGGGTKFGGHPMALSEALIPYTKR
jgi:hypothetical protein